MTKKMICKRAIARLERRLALMEQYKPGVNDKYTFNESRKLTIECEQDLKELQCT